MSANDPFYEEVARAYITDLHRWSNTSGVQHEWTTLRIELTDEIVLCIRVERRRKSDGLQLGSISSIFEAHDEVCCQLPCVRVHSSADCCARSG